MVVRVSKIDKIGKHTHCDSRKCNDTSATVVSRGLVKAEGSDFEPGVKVGRFDVEVWVIG